MHTQFLALMAVMGCVAVASCSQGSAGSDGDCGADVRLHGDTYRAAPGLHIPHRGEPVGAGTWLDCEGDPVPALGQAQVFTIRSQDPSRLVIVAHDNKDTVFMNDTIAWRQRPQLVKDSEHNLACSGPARFTGIWNYVEPEDMPDMEDYDSARVPYAGNFSVWKGTGVGLDRWAEVTLQAEISSDTETVPSAESLERATTRDVPVTVTATCRGKSFLVDRIRFAR